MILKVAKFIFINRGRRSSNLVDRTCTQLIKAIHEFMMPLKLWSLLRMLTIFINRIFIYNKDKLYFLITHSCSNLKEAVISLKLISARIIRTYVIFPYNYLQITYWCYSYYIIFTFLYPRNLSNANYAIRVYTDFPYNCSTVNYS